MSWWVYLEDDECQSVEVEQHSEGGTYALGGTGDADLNVTYNYGTQFRKVWPESLPDTGCLKGM